MRTREAVLPDAEQIHALISAYSGDGTLLPRTLAEICENVRDFVVLEHDGRIIGCGALHLYGVHLAEIRSITVDPSSQSRGGGRRLVKALLAQAEKHKVSCVCLFTRIPEFFSRMGFSLANHEDLPDKIHKDCYQCPRLYRCDEVAMIRGKAAHVCNFAAAQKLAEDTGMTSLRHSPEKIRLPLGFSFSAVAAGIKVSGRPDLALVEAAGGATAAALFTKNRVVAAPVEVGRAALLSTGGRVRAVVVNSGNANCATGRAGIQACERVCREAGKLLGVPAAEIFPSSTGIIGVRLPAEKILAKLPELIAARSASQRGVLAFAHAIMTTDTRPKIASVRFRASSTEGSKEVTVLGHREGRRHDSSAACDLARVLVHRCGCECAGAAASSARGVRPIR